MTQEICGRMDLDAASIMVDAARWRALVGCERVRVLGGACLGTPDALLAVEFYVRYALRDSAMVKKLHAESAAELTAFADHARRLQAASLRASVTCASCSRPMEEHGPPHGWDTQQLPSCPSPSLTGTWRAPDTVVQRRRATQAVADSVGSRVHNVRLVLGDGRRTPMPMRAFAALIREATGKHIDISAISLIERDKQDPSLSQAAAIAAVDPERRGPCWLAWGGVPDPTPSSHPGPGN